ncbi:hypothetical protein G7084_00500 [Weissella coleopterorum]|uniref:Uncharacterized protein n=1 Tax=Weissella coleopterorum TaxID=2714949 RepID=A0A6G8AXZ9_9LACO|nr:hypothetical protein [Weissella coleopterorum]QIL49839.1 hypothetical protein G7084_00500 [Weissella coleopterorum]
MTINKFGNLSVQGTSLGKLPYVGPNKVGNNSDVKVAVVNMGDSFETMNILPQPGFDYNKPFGLAMKLINGKIGGGEAKTNRSGGARVATFSGTLVEETSSERDSIPEVEFDSTFITGKNHNAVAQIRSKDAFDKENLILFGIDKNLKMDSRNAPERNEAGEPIISNYQLNFVPAEKATKGELSEDDYIRVLLVPAIYDNVKDKIKRGVKIVPQGLQFAFVGNDATDWTVYAQDLTIVEGQGTTTLEKPVESKPTPAVENKPANESKPKADNEKGAKN